MRLRARARRPLLLALVAVAVLCGARGERAAAPAWRAGSLSAHLERASRVVFWKLKKVGGSTVCAVLGNHASLRNLSVASNDDPRLALRKTWRRTGLADLGAQRVTRYSDCAHYAASEEERGARQQQRQRRRQEGQQPRGGLAAEELRPPAAPPGLPDVACCHNTFRWRGLAGWLAGADAPPPLQLVMLRQPLARAVSQWAFHTHAPAAGLPPGEGEAREWLSGDVHGDARDGRPHGSYLAQWVERPAESFAAGSEARAAREAWPTGCTGCDGGTTAAARASEVALAELRGRAPPLVLLFERMDESLALLADALGAPLQAAVVPHMKHRPHRTAAEWPAEAVAWYNATVAPTYGRVYAAAVAAFDAQVAAYDARRGGKGSLRAAVARLRALREAAALPEVQCPQCGHNRKELLLAARQEQSERQIWT